MYVVISGSDDGHIPYVERHLDEPFILLDFRDVLTEQAYTYSFEHGKTEICKGGQPLRDVRSVWYRRIMPVAEDTLPVAPGKKYYVQNAIRYFGNLIFQQLTESFWISNHFAIEKANDKLLQLQTASRLGFRVPDTLFTSSASEAQRFVNAHKTVVTKPNYSSHFRQEGKNYGFFTSSVDTSTDFSGLHLAPAIFQAAIEVKAELRITVVGSKVFAASITCDNGSVVRHIRDWRAARMAGTATLKPFYLPQTISDKCVTLVKEFGLQFGAIDAIIDKSDKLWFLENNPNGQWAFIEEATGQPVGKAVADLLMRQAR